ncbi:Maf family protein [Sulfurirhabdus autotrophica]|uniref:7-methyl-GTP pyrophosphatase n=1 Tax=Sulfurirhabdus autotrophica TaxID=1706046 RepID=A0A4V2W303_9PROT|nr:Maf family nucleotide pyrophosphatase [Sulfurirhabdus autotrophica]TCV90059.1 septum formation protein [Sulfurirhabdus autotrophica]
MNEFHFVLASTSVYRRELLSRLQIPFSIASPDVDETAFSEEQPEETAERLALYKARAVKDQFQKALIVGSDQVAVLEGVLLGKPHTHDNAVKQLQFMSGKTVVFHTALCLYNSWSGNAQTTVVPYKVKFRNLTNTQIQNYLLKEQPYNCAGSAKTEGLGIALIENLEGNDPNALIGLPLIQLTEMLLNENVDVLSWNPAYSI